MSIVPLPQSCSTNLAEKDEVCERYLVDPMHTAQDAEAGEAPPGVAHLNREHST